MENGNPDLKYINAAFVGKQTKGSHLKKRLSIKSFWAERKLLKRLIQYYLITPILFFLKVFTS